MALKDGLGFVGFQNPRPNPTQSPESKIFDRKPSSKPGVLGLGRKTQEKTAQCRFLVRARVWCFWKRIFRHENLMNPFWIFLMYLCPNPTEICFVVQKRDEKAVFYFDPNPKGPNCGQNIWNRIFLLKLPHDETNQSKIGKEMSTTEKIWSLLQ